MNSRKVYIAVPTYSGDINCHTTISLTRAVAEAKEAGWNAEIAVRPLDSLLPRCRNAMLTDFMKSGATDLVFWDADIACAPGDFSKLLAYDVDLVGGIYRLKRDKESYIFRQLPGPLKADRETGLIKVEGIGTGFMRITRRAIAQMISAFPDLWIDDRGTHMIWLFDFELRDHQYFSEDFVFCRRFREAGGTVWASPEFRLHHTGTKTFSGCFADFQARQRAMTISNEELEAEGKRLANADLSAIDGMLMLAAK